MKKSIFCMFLFFTTGCNPDITSLCGGYTTQNGKAVAEFDHAISGLDAKASLQFDEKGHPQLQLNLNKNAFDYNQTKAQTSANDYLSINLKTENQSEDKQLPLDQKIPVAFTYTAKPPGETVPKTIEGKGELMLKQQELMASGINGQAPEIKRISGTFTSLETDHALTGSFEVEKNILSEICKAH